MDFGIPRNKVRIFMVNVDWEFLGIPNCNNSGSKNLEIPRNSKLMTNRTWNSNSEHQWLSLKGCGSKNSPETSRNVWELMGIFKQKFKATDMK